MSEHASSFEFGFEASCDLEGERRLEVCHEREIISSPQSGNINGFELPGECNPVSNSVGISVGRGFRCSRTHLRGSSSVATYGVVANYYVRGDPAVSIWICAQSAGSGVSGGDAVW